MKKFPEEIISKILLQKGLLIATAESCTGGLMGHRITNIAGSSKYYLGSIIAYANDVKLNLLKVNIKIIEEHGAVSAECVAEMALGVCQVLKADIGISVTGIAGPSGGTIEKPVGLVYFGLKTPDGIWTSTQHFEGNRLEVKEKASDYGLSYLLMYLEGNIDQ